MLKKTVGALLKALCMYAACFAALLYEYSADYNGYLWFYGQPANLFNISRGGGFWASAIFQLNKLSQILGGYSFGRSLAFIAFFIFFAFIAEKYIQKPSGAVIVTSFVFALTLLMGKAYSEYSSMNIYFASALNTIFFVMMLLGLMFFFAAVFSYIMTLFSKARESQSEGESTPFFNFLFSRHPLLIPFLVIVIAWLPMLAAQYPGGMISDSAYQLAQAMGLYPVTDANPPFYTFLMAIFVNAGAALGSKEAGLFCFILSQVTLTALIMAYSLKTLREMHVGCIPRFALLLFYMFLPMYSAYASTLLKDSLYIALMLLYFVMLAKLFSARADRSGDITLSDMLPVAVLQLFIMLTRHNGIVVILPVSVAMIIVAFRKERFRKKTLCILPLLSIILFLLITGIVYPFLGVQQNSAGNSYYAMETTVQQTARYLICYPEDISAEERAIIGKVMDIDAATANYDPACVDSVRNSAVNLEATPTELIGFLKVWLKLLLRHPGVCFDAFAEQNHYIYCANTDNSVYYIAMHGDWIIAFERPEALKSFNAFMGTLYDNLKSLPVISLLENCAFWLWAYILLLVYKIKNKLKLNMPIITAVIFCVICALLAPAVKMHPRYLLPYVWPAAFVICVNLRQNGSETATQLM